MIQMIKDMKGNWVERNNEIAEAALKFFEHLFIAEDTPEDNSIMKVVKKVIFEDDNYALTTIHVLEKVKMMCSPLIMTVPHDQVV